MGHFLAFIVSLQILAMVSVLERPAAGAEVLEQNLHASLEAELSLAKEKAVYVVCDPGGGEIEIKARGMTLKSLPVADYRVYGRTPPAGPLKLVKKDALSEPKREQIKPEAAKETEEPAEEPEEETKSKPSQDAYDVKALEVHDMPPSFSVRLEEGVILHISPIPETFKGRLLAVVSGLQRGIVRPVKRLWHAARKAPHTEFEITLAEADAKALYWHLAEETRVLLRDSGRSAGASQAPAARSSGEKRKQ